METKKCAKCKKILTKNKFFKDKSKKDGLGSYCKECFTKQIKIYKQKIRENNKNINPYEKNKIKICSRCKKEKTVTEFDRHSQTIGGLKSYCKECNKQIKDNYYKRNTKKNKKRDPYADSEKTKICEICHKEKFLTDFSIKRRYADGLNNTCKTCHNNKIKEYLKRPDIKSKRNKQLKNKLKTNTIFKLSFMMSKSIRNALKNKGGKRKNHWESLVDYTKKSLRKHIEKQFTKGMTWDNYGIKGWHIDHIKPISSFDITDYNCADFKKCFALNNLQPLWAKDNLQKGNTISAKWNNL